MAADLDRHLTGCPACSVDARSAASFDRAVADAMRAVTIPGGLRDRLSTLASAHRGAVIRQKVYHLAALAASLFLGVGLAFGVFSASRPKIDTNHMVELNDELIQNPDGKLQRWLAEQKFPDRLPEPFDSYLLFTLGNETIQGKNIPVVVFRHPTDPRGFAKVYFFRDDGTYNLKYLQDAQASHTLARVIDDPASFRGVKYVIVHTVHPPRNPQDDLLKPFLRQNGLPGM